MRFIIDGYNLIHRSGLFDYCGGDITRSREKLENTLLNYLSSRKGLSATLIYDSRGSRHPSNKKVSSLLSIHFAHGDADSEINSIIRRQSSNRNIVVVSTDIKDILNTAKRERVRRRTSESFWRLISSPFNNSKAESPSMGIKESDETTNWYRSILEKRGRL